MNEISNSRAGVEGKKEEGGSEGREGEGGIEMCTNEPEIPFFVSSLCLTFGHSHMRKCH